MALLSAGMELHSKALRWGRYPLRPGASAQEVDKAIEKVGKAVSAYHKAYPMKNGATILDVARNSLARQVLHTMAKSHDFRDLERIANHDLRHCDELSDDKAINLVAGTLESIMSADTSTGQDEKRLIEARQHKMTIYR